MMECVPGHGAIIEEHREDVYALAIAQPKQFRSGV
jgi:hypothetical protein